MSKTPIYWSKALKFLSKDKIMKKLITKYKDKTLTTRKDIFLQYSNSLVYYSCLEADRFFFNTISLLNIIKEDRITIKDPIKVLFDGTSFQIK